jgi:hypothetical protein
MHKNEKEKCMAMKMGDVIERKKKKRKRKYMLCLIHYIRDNVVSVVLVQDLSVQLSSRWFSIAMFEKEK